MTGLLGYGACYEAMNEADLLVLLGTDFPYQDFLPAAHTVQVDHDATRLGRRTPLDFAVHGAGSTPSRPTRTTSITTSPPTPSTRPGASIRSHPTTPSSPSIPE